MRKNVPITGFIIGLILPIVGFALVYFAWFNGRPVGSVINSLMHDGMMAGKVLTMSLLVNLVPFMYFNIKRLDYALKGTVIATTLYGVFIVIIMYVW